MTAKTKEMELNAALKEIYEIWAGSEGIPLPKTAPEAYLLGLVEQMRDIARDALASASTKPKYLSWQHAKWCASFGIPDDPNAKRPDCDCFMQRMEKIPVDRSVVQQALHVAMAAEHPVKLIAALRAALAEPETCTWQQDGDSDSGVYGTSCRHYFDITDGTPEDNKMAWCCYCGKKLAQSLITEDEDE